MVFAVFLFFCMIMTMIFVYDKILLDKIIFDIGD